ncbi:MAG: hypothetical protein IT344_08750 [Candidatus Dadabacteria bacterium]|nr:hypothetical protein [Candidatus Dadabacteria bacterium]
MPRQTQVEFKVVVKCIRKCAAEKFAKFKIIEKSGSAIRFELFENDSDDVPTAMWVMHRSKYIYTDDLKKACANLKVTEKELLGYS